MFQVNQSLDLIIYVSGGQGGFLDSNSWVYGAIFALLLGVVIIGGIKRIAACHFKISSKYGNYLYSCGTSNFNCKY